MKSRVLDHLLSVVVVALVLGTLVLVFSQRESSVRNARLEQIAPYLEIEGLNLGDPLHAALFRESLHVFHPQSPERVDTILAAIESFRKDWFTKREYKSGEDDRILTASYLLVLGGMYLRFIMVYVVVMILSYLAMQSIAISRFVRMKQGKGSLIFQFIDSVREWKNAAVAIGLRRSVLILAEGLLITLLFGILFSPAYVVAYSIRSGFPSDSDLFLILLATATNGLVISSANKFFTFLVAESRKGYVQTAIVKNLSDSYRWNKADGVPYRAVVQPRKLLPSHVFRHVYVNAHFQYLPSLKEHATFLITGLIIIEMALNIQGHLGYELMQTILFRKYDLVLLIILGIFVVVKITDLVVDLWVHGVSVKYENHSST